MWKIFLNFLGRYIYFIYEKKLLGFLGGRDSIYNKAYIASLWVGQVSLIH